ncbi:hypothetical protein N7499_003801 [Penicillium canescens]|nr:hypothetical protein N7499_003801 [Penicillium canescens]
MPNVTAIFQSSKYPSNAPLIQSSSLTRPKAAYLAAIIIAIFASTALRHLLEDEQPTFIKGGDPASGNQENSSPILY